MYGNGAGQVASVTTGAVSTVAGAAVLPNTGGNPLLIALSLISLLAGVIVLGSFTFTRLASLLNRK
jgi:uncharacterized membrane protein HdeD (DUF308 family)